MIMRFHTNVNIYNYYNNINNIIRQVHHTFHTKLQIKKRSMLVIEYFSHPLLIPMSPTTPFVGTNLIIL